MKDRVRECEGAVLRAGEPGGECGRADPGGREGDQRGDRPACGDQKGDPGSGVSGEGCDVPAAAGEKEPAVLYLAEDL